MRYVAAYLLAILGGKENPSKKDLETIINAVGIEVDVERINTVISSLKGLNIDDLVAKGNEKLASMPTARAVSSAVASPGAAAAPAAAVEEKKAEKKAEKAEESEHSDDDMGFGLFD